MSYLKGIRKPTQNTRESFLIHLTSIEFGAKIDFRWSWSGTQLGFSTWSNDQLQKPTIASLWTVSKIYVCSKIDAWQVDQKRPPRIWSWFWDTLWIWNSQLYFILCLTVFIVTDFLWPESSLSEYDSAGIESLWNKVRGKVCPNPLNE